MVVGSCYCHQGDPSGHVAHVAELLEPRAPERSIGGIVDELISKLGARLTPSPLATADALFGTPGWLVPATLAAGAAAIVGGLYATGNLTRGARKRKIARRRAKR